MEWKNIQANSPVTGIRPIQLFFEKGVSDLEKKAVREGISQVLETSGIYKSGILDSLGLYPSDLINVNLGVEGVNTVKRCLNVGRGFSDNKKELNANMMISSLIPENCKDYHLLVIKDPIYSVYPYEESMHIYGVTSMPASIISTSDFSKFKDLEKYLGLKALTVHEAGHLIGNLPYSKEKDSKGNPRNTLDSFGKHCSEAKCLMRQSYSPEEIVKRGIYIQSNPIFCLDCTRGLINSLMEQPSTQWRDFFSGFH